MNIAEKHSRSTQARYQLSNALRIVTSGRRLDKLCQPQARQHANAQRRLDQIYDVDPIEAPTELKVIQTLSIRESLFAPFDAEQPLGVVLRMAVRRAAAAQQLAVPPVDRLRLLTRRDALAVCFTVLVPISAAKQRTRRLGAAREVVWKCAEKEKKSLKRLESRSGYRPWRGAILRCDIVQCELKIISEDFA